MANLDISSKLGKTKQELTIAKGLTFEIDCSAETMLKAEEKFKEGTSSGVLFEILGMFLGEDAVNKVKELKPTVKQLETIILATMAQVNEEDFEEFQKRFQNRNK